MVAISRSNSIILNVERYSLIVGEHSPGLKVHNSFIQIKISCERIVQLAKGRSFLKSSSHQTFALKHLPSIRRRCVNDSASHLAAHAHEQRISCDVPTSLGTLANVRELSRMLLFVRAARPHRANSRSLTSASMLRGLWIESASELCSVLCTYFSLNVFGLHTEISFSKNFTPNRLNNHAFLHFHFYTTLVRFENRVTFMILFPYKETSYLKIRIYTCCV